LPEEIEQETGGIFPIGDTVACGGNADEREGQEDRHRIVDAGFDFERRGDTCLQAKAAQMEKEKDRGSIGRTDDRAEQESFRPAESEEVLGGQAGDRCRQDDADGGESKARPKGTVQRVAVGTQAAIEEDERQREGADQIGNGEIVENDAAGTVLTRQHAESKEDKQQRRADPRGQHARENRECDQTRRNQNDLVGKIHAMTPILMRVPPTAGPTAWALRPIGTEIPRIANKALRTSVPQGARDCPRRRGSAVRRCAGDADKLSVTARDIAPILRGNKRHRRKQ